MKKYLIITQIIILLTSSQLVQAQSKDPNSGVFVELLGNGLLYSLNYDTRFTSAQDGIGGRAGISYVSMDGLNLATIPLMANYLLGKNGKYFEIGVGATYVALGAGVKTSGSNSPWYIADGWLGTMSLGYRSQPVDGGFLFRAGVTPLFGFGYFWPIYPQVSFGYAF
jgi:hypothetical protein